jgi:hypothetical protein
LRGQHDAVSADARRFCFARKERPLQRQVEALRLDQTNTLIGTRIALAFRGARGHGSFGSRTLRSAGNRHPACGSRAMRYVRGGAMIASKEVAIMSTSPSNGEQVTADSMGGSPDLTDRERHAKELAYLGCAGALGYGLMKVVWALGGTVGIRNPNHFHAIENDHGWGQWFFDHWATPILAGLAIVILLGLVYPWGNRPILRPLLRTLGWAGALMAVLAWPASS